ncbi:MAG: diaminopimelate epimerase [Gammaproteobacteria bacterium]|nr:diaminopimelate epimerase [Gammaproteobacteria bacterium]MDE0366948.1 diaminopimelate epimerase [Gammaproteobacteria bacterium]
MNLRFAKMHGLGNDFMVIDLVTQNLEIEPETVRRWSNRRTGIGFDQLLTLECPTEPDADFWFRIYNADGSGAEQCGNGARCIAHFVRRENLSPKTELELQTESGRIHTVLVDQGVRVDMGIPSTHPDDVPFAAEQDRLSHVVEVEGEVEGNVKGEVETYEITPVSMGNPHGVLFVESAGTADVAAAGSALTGHRRFPQGANIGFCEVVDRGFVRLRVYERGVGETPACGTGACAAVVAGRLKGKLDESVKVSLPGGKVRIAWKGPGAPVRMTGPAELVYEGHVEF